MIFKLLKQIMVEFNLKQTDLAEVLGASLSRVKSMTSGRVKNLTREESEALVDKLGINANWLVTGEGPMRQDDESQDAFSGRMQAIKRMHALINSMSLRELSRIRLCALMTGEPDQDGACLAKALHDEALGVDFVTGKPIDGAAAPTRLPADEQMWLDCYRGWDLPVKRKELARAFGLPPTELPQIVNVPPTAVQVSGNQQHNTGDGVVQIGSMGHAPVKRRR